MIIAIIFMLIFAGTSLYLAKRLYNVTAEAADMRGFYDGLARRYEPFIHGSTASADDPAPEPKPEKQADDPAPEPEPEKQADDPAPEPEPEKPADDPAPEPEPEKPADDPAPKPARNTTKSKKTGRKPAAGRKGRKQ